MRKYANKNVIVNKIFFFLLTKRGANDPKIIQQSIRSHQNSNKSSATDSHIQI